MINKRQELIVSLVKEKKFVSVDDLSELLHYSQSTVRRDLVELEKLMMIKRVSGGALHIRNEFTENPTEIKYQVNSKEKMQIADLALDFIEDYSTIFLDSSSTSQYLAKLLINKKNLTIFTTNISTADLLDKQLGSHKIYMIGGKLSNGKVNGPLSEYFLQSFYVDQAFISCRGIGSDGYISELLEEEATMKKLIRSQSKQLFLLADSSKFLNSFGFRGLTLKEIDLLISDKPINKPISDLLQKNNVEFYS